MDYKQFEAEGWPWWSSPFNGQSRRLFIVSVLGSVLRPKFAIETGTYIGTTTHFFNGLGVDKTYSIEIVKEYALVARKRHKQLIQQGKLEIILGSSSDHIVKILKRISNDVPVIAYLDAHWHDFLPTKKEITALIEWGGPFIAIVDDFQVPDFPGYDFDSYGEEIVGPRIVPVHPEISLWIPDESEEIETGARRGTGYIFSKKALALFPSQTLIDLKLRKF